jgi:hypothetical protein
MAAATRLIFTPYNAEYPASAFPQLLLVNQRPALAFDAAADEACYWTAIAPIGIGTAYHAKVFYIMASATSNEVVLMAAIEAITEADAVDLDNTTSFDSDNSVTDTVPGTAGYLGMADITLTNYDSIAAGDYFRLRLTRDANHADDDATGDCYVLAVELTDGN